MLEIRGGAKQGVGEEINWVGLKGYGGLSVWGWCLRVGVGLNSVKLKGVWVELKGMWVGLKGVWVGLKGVWVWKIKWVELNGVWAG